MNEPKRIIGISTHRYTKIKGILLASKHRLSYVVDIQV
jgi:hypothetical protein